MKRYIPANRSLTILWGAVLGLLFTSPLLAYGARLTASTLKTSRDIPAVSQISNVPLADVNCWPVDVVALIDQSQSMYATAAPSDKQGYRFRAAKELLNRLITNRLDKCPEAVHRLAVVTWGSKATIQLSLSPIDLSKDDDRVKWPKPYRSQIDAGQHDTRQNATDPRVGLHQAYEILANAPSLPEPANYGPRRKIVILLTDGDPQNGSSGFSSQVMCQLRSEFDNSNSKWQDYHLWVVALKAGESYLNRANGCRGAALLTDYQTITRSHYGDLLELGYNEQTVPSSLGRIISAELGEPGTLIKCGEPFYVDPYLRQLTFRFYRNDEIEGSRVTLTKLDTTGTNPVIMINGENIQELQKGVLSQMTLARYDVAEGMEFFTFDRPRPGTWQFMVEGLTRLDCQRKVDAQQYPEQGKINIIEPANNATLAQVNTPPYYLADQPNSITVKLINDAGEPLASESDYPLDVSVIYTTPKGTAYSINKLAPSADGLWNSNKESLLTPDIGSYSMEIVGTARSANPHQTDKIKVSSLTSQFVVSNLRVLAFAIQSPQSNEVVSCNKVTNGKLVGIPISVTVRFLDDTQAPANASRYLVANADHPFEASLLDGDEKELEHITLTSSSTDPSLFVGEFLSGNTDIAYCDAAIGRPTPQRINVTFNGEYDTNTYTMRKRSNAVTFSRVRSEGVRINALSPAIGAQLEIHSGVCSTLFASDPQSATNSVRVELGLINSNGQPVFPAAVIQPASDPSSLIEVTLTGPKTGQSERMKIALEDSATSGQMLVATGGISITDEGDYRIDVVPNSKAFRQGYVAETFTPVTFSRVDRWVNRPSVCYPAIGGLGLGVVGVKAGMRRALTGFW